MKILVINSGPDFFGALYAEGLDPYCEEVKSFNPYPLCGYKYELTEDQKKSMITAKDLPNVLQSFDVVIGADHGTLPHLAMIKKKYPNLVVGVQVLDYQKHVFKRDKNYNHNAASRWEHEYPPFLKEMDFVAHNQHNAIDSLSKWTSDAVVEFVRFPVNPHPTLNNSRADYIVYSGRLAPDKGVYNVVSALSLLEEDIELVTIGRGYDYSSFAEHLGVRYKEIKQCSELKKWQMYHDCRFTVCGAENPYIPALCVLEGISIGRSGVVSQSKENELHYKGYVAYAEMGNINKLANAIKFMYNNPKTADQLAENGPKFYKEECSYKAWGDKIYSMIERVPFGNI